MNDATSPTAVDHRARVPWLAALLSFAFPGLGHLYAARWRLAAAFGIPMAILVGVIGLVWLDVIDVRPSALLSTRFLVFVLVVNAAVMVWRALAIAHAALTPRAEVVGVQRRNATVAAALLVLATIAMHVWVGVVIVNLERTLSEVFGGLTPGVEQPNESPGPTLAPGETPTPAPPRWNGTEVINVLLLGTDETPERDSVLTDVILAVSIDPVAETAVMVSIPRDTGFVPLPDRSIYSDGLYPDKINSIYARAANAPAVWCPDIPADPNACGLRQIEAAVGLYLGIEIDHYALVDMSGFADLIDALGGLELCLPGRLVDPNFDGTLENAGEEEGLVLPAGCTHYDGLSALAFARSRQGWIELPDGTRDDQNDFDRNERQQELLLAMREELAEADTFLELPGILSAIASTVSTDFPRDQAGELATLLPLIAGPDIERIVLSYPEYVDLPLDPTANYLLVPRRDAIRGAMTELFGADELRGWYLATEDLGP
ncbi:MAG TPA: LCP family protein [Candidatus Limnocylindria bacterium]